MIPYFAYILLEFFFCENNVFKLVIFCMVVSNLRNLFILQLQVGPYIPYFTAVFGIRADPVPRICTSEFRIRIQLRIRFISSVT